MKHVNRYILFFSMSVCMLIISACSEQNTDLSGKWSLKITNFKSSTGGQPIVSDTLQVEQKGQNLSVIIEIRDENETLHKGTFNGALNKLNPPCEATLIGNFVVGDFTTEETLKVNFPNDKEYSGQAKWETKSKDGKVVSTGSQDMNGAKKIKDICK